ncbi:MAG: hypothetical protein R3E98_05435 [Gemmatimonadota bacterium]|nr:hypothetical protein [Gemmatimonadota bacterium]
MSPTGFMEQLRRPGPLVAVELRPPRSGLDPAESMDVWIDMHHTLQALTRAGRPVLITDNAVAVEEEENLAHLTANLPADVTPRGIAPFLTCKHTLEYCLLYASRAASHGFEALTVLGGDRFGGPPRCVPHAYELRQRIREAVPSLKLGGWINPHRDIEQQVRFALDPRFTADFILTQVVSHHSLDRVEAVQEGLRAAGVDLPVVWGVFLYRSANPRTLARLNEYFPVPAEALTDEFATGVGAEELAGRTVAALRGVGADKVYVSNLGFRGAERTLKKVLSQV